VSLRANTYIVLMSSLFLALAIVLAGLLYATRVNVVTVEVRSASEEMQRIVRVIGHEQDMLDDSEADWAKWDDAYAFVRGTRPDFPAVNLPAGEVASLDLNAVAFFDATGHMVWSRERDLGEGTKPLSQRMLDQLMPKALRGSATQPTRRIAAIGGRLVIESISPITNSEGTAPPEGTLLFVRAIDNGVVRSFAGSSGASLAVFDWSSPPTEQAHTARDSLSAASPVWIGLTRPHEVVAYALLPQAAAIGPTLILSAPMHTLAYDVTPPLIALLVAALVVVGLAWSNATFRLIEHTSLSRMSWLRHSVASVGASGQAESRIDMDRAPSGDEVLGVASEINTMLDALESSQRARFESEERMRALVENMADAVLVIDLGGIVTYASSRVIDITGRTPESLVGTDIRTVLTTASHPAIAHLLESQPPREGPLSAEITFVNGLGATTPAEVSASPVRNPAGAITGFQLIARDMSERKSFEDQLVHLADHDHLTGLYNRRRFEEELARELAESRRHGSVGSLLWLDLDGFKEINDSLGHRRGDELLVDVATKLLASSRADQIVARLGGDEFAVLLPNATPEQAMHAAARILAEVRTGVGGEGGEPVWITASIGVVSFPEHGTGVEELTSHADFAMYLAKREGRNRFAIYQPEDGWTQQLTERRSWASRIESALQEERFIAYAQPIVSLADGSTEAYELLVRLRAEDGEIVTPTTFLDAAENLGLVSDIDRYMIRRAVSLIEQAREQDVHLSLHVNLSAATIGDQGLLRFVTRLLNDSEIDPSCLGFEITETALIRNMGRALRFMSELRKLGCKFSLDDFGSGFTSFYQLRHMPIDLIKIDGTIVRELPSNQLDQHVLRAIVELARGLDLRSVAEWVEDEATLELLRGFDVDLVQGFHVAQPFPAENLVALPPSDSALPA
jgi:diguanylate cyclase (GGDEF)-like protein/PAS domain S-box-containing protein